MFTFLHHYVKILQQEKVLQFSFLCALFSMFLVPPNLAYLQYIDIKVMILLFSFMVLVKGFEVTGVFAVLSQRIIQHVSNFRKLSLVLITFTFFFSMWVTNDVALITMAPFTILLLTSSGQTNGMIPLLVFETVAANLGSMLTPFGNPQNLYLFSYYDLSGVWFFQLMLPVTAVSLVMLCLCVYCIKNTSVSIRLERKYQITEKRESIIYAGLFILCILTLFGWIHPVLMLFIILGCIGWLRPILLKKVDYILLLIFLCFFIFIGNIKSIPEVQDWMHALVDGRVFLVSVCTSQIISNVPSAMLLSAFTEDVKGLLYGVNIGGLGTPIASLASLITLKFYSHTTRAKPMRYLIYFTGVQIVFLGVLIMLFKG